jgi:hypothetical protein
MRAGRGQTANFRQTAPEIHVSPRIAGNSLSVPGHYIIRGKLAAKFSHIRREFIEMPGSDGAC